jgi:hypothetical protein
MQAVSITRAKRTGRTPYCPDGVREANGISRRQSVSSDTDHKQKAGKFETTQMEMRENNSDVVDGDSAVLGE